MRFKLKISLKCCFSLIFTHYIPIFHFASSVTALIIQAKSPCDNSGLNGVKGVITSPNYPSPYPEEVECEWKIRSPSNSALKITILDLDLSEDENCSKSPCCSRQGLSISQEGSPILLCGHNATERTIILYQQLTYVKYVSSRANQPGRGFKIMYSIERHACKPDEFPCMDGRCYPKSSFCNGHNDCGDGSDEMYCFSVQHSTTFGSVKKQILENHALEGGMCKKGSVSCSLSPDHCYFPETELCDGKFHCPKGEDEVGCVPECPKRIACSSGDGCYYPVHRCNSIRNCRDNSDETGCPSEPCIAMQFTCLNGACISGSAICDGEDDCGDFSDEENCAKSSFMKAAVVGLLTCIMLFCIVLGCMYHVYTARLRASANFVHQLETEPSDDDFMYREPPPAYSVAVNDPRIITYPTADITERFFEGDHGMRYQGARSARRSRRQNQQGNAESTSRGPSSMLQTRGLSAGGGGGSDYRGEPKTDDNTKAQERANRPDFHRQLELFRFVHPTDAEEQILTDPRRNESPCSSPSLSPSRESMTSCTSLEEIEDLVSLFQH